MNKWATLFAELELVGENKFPCRNADFDGFETELSIKFPCGYKEFCQIFGSGQLGGWVKIFCPCNIQSWADIRENKFMLDALKQELKNEERRLEKAIPGVEKAIVEIVQKVLSNAFAFGDNPNAETFVWDLNSYSESDQSCDIYLIGSDNLEHTFKVGRDFYEFVSGFCLSEKSNDVLPAKMRFYEREKISATFLPLE